MSVKKFLKLIKKCQNKIWERENYKILKKDAFNRVKSRNIEIATVIDIGASDGHWSKECMSFFPDAQYFLIEAQLVHIRKLKNFCKYHNNAKFISAAAGDKDGEVFFDISDPFGGAAFHSEKQNLVSLPSRTLDSCVKEFNLKAPFLIKFDTHGFEVPILQGAKETLKQANLIIMECYNFDINENSLKFYDMCKYMENLGFRPVDIIEPLFRKNDSMLWQMDIFFAPAGGKEFQSNSYR